MKILIKSSARDMMLLTRGECDSRISSISSALDLFAPSNRSLHSSFFVCVCACVCVCKMAFTFKLIMQYKCTPHIFDA